MSSVLRIPRVPAIPGLLLLFLLAGGCAWHTVGSDHYVGPVFFRYRESAAGGSFASEVVRAGLGADAGMQWGFVLGVSRRLLVSAPDSCGIDVPSSHPRLRTVPASLAAPDAGRWHFSPLYLWVERPPESTFVARTMFGAEVAAGQELFAVSAGATHRTLLTQPDDSTLRLRFDSGQPLDTRLELCRQASERSPLLTSPKESHR